MTIGPLVIRNVSNVNALSLVGNTALILDSDTVHMVTDTDSTLKCLMSCMGMKLMSRDAQFEPCVAETQHTVAAAQLIRNTHLLTHMHERIAC